MLKRLETLMSIRNGRFLRARRLEIGGNAVVDRAEKGEEAYLEREHLGESLARLPMELKSCWGAKSFHFALSLALSLKILFSRSYLQLSK